MLHFTIRDVLWLTVVVAMAVAWSLDRRQVKRTTMPITEAQKLFIATRQLVKNETGKDIAVQYEGRTLTEPNP